MSSIATSKNFIKSNNIPSPTDGTSFNPPSIASSDSPLNNIKHELAIEHLKTITNLLQSNKNWVKTTNLLRPGFLANSSKPQTPTFLWISCSDSRISPEIIVNVGPGEMFVHRNIANICLHTDLNFLSVLQFSVDELKVPYIIVCGHHGCGGVQAAMSGLNHGLGLVDNWLRSVKDVYAKNSILLDSIKDETAKLNKLSELNVANSVLNICNTTIVQDAWARNQPLVVVGWVYELEFGIIKDLELYVSGQNQIESVYNRSVSRKIE